MLFRLGVPTPAQPGPGKGVRSIPLPGPVKEVSLLPPPPPPRSGKGVTCAPPHPTVKEHSMDLKEHLLVHARNTL